MQVRRELQDKQSELDGKKILLITGGHPEGQCPAALVRPPPSRALAAPRGAGAGLGGAAGGDPEA